MAPKATTRANPTEGILRFVVVFLLASVLMGGPFPGTARAVEAGANLSPSVGEDAALPPPTTGRVRLLTHNIQWGMGADGVEDLDRIVDHLRRIDADIVILNEVDVNWRRSGNVDQPRYIQDKTGYPYASFGPALSTWSSGNLRISRYGNLLLSRFPIVSSRNFKLPVRFGREPRAAVVAELDVHGEPWIVAGTHLGLHQDDRHRQTAELLQSATAQARDAWRRAMADDDGEGMGYPSHGPIVIMGDFNARPSAPELAVLRSAEDNSTKGCQGPFDADASALAVELAPMVDVFAVAGSGPGHTFPYPEPYARIDYVFVSADLQERIIEAQTLPWSGSDHLPVVVDVAAPVALPVFAEQDRIWAGWGSDPCRTTAE